MYKRQQVSLDMKLQAFAVERLQRGNYDLVFDDNKNIKNQINKLKNFRYVSVNHVYINKKKKVVNPHSGSLIVMDINNGEILCSVSSPGFDPNIFSKDLEVDDWNYVKNNSRSPLLNRSMAGVYPPGSTIKMAVALAALESGIIDLSLIHI